MSDGRQLVVVGAGALGQVYAGLLATAGEKVWLLATTRAAEELVAGGSINLTGAIERCVPIASTASRGSLRLTDDPRAIDGPVDGILFATKAHQLDFAARGTVELHPRFVLGVQNGLGKDGVLGRYFGNEKVIGAVTVLAVLRLGPGPVTVTAIGATYLGLEDKDLPENVLNWANALNRAGLPVEVVQNIEAHEWSKAIHSSAVFAMSLLSGIPWGAGRRSRDLLGAFIDLNREGVAVADAAGVPVVDFGPTRTLLCSTADREIAIDELLSRASGTDLRRLMPSMHQDLVAGRRLEVEETIGDLVRRAHIHSVPVPRLDFAYAIARALDDPELRRVAKTGRLDLGGGS